MTRFPKSGTDINVWALTLADVLRVIGQENIIIEANGNNPPTVKAGSKFLVYKEHSYLIPDTLPTGNNVYPADTAVTTPISEAIFLSADVPFAWSTGGVPAKTNSTQYFIVCSGGEDVDETSQGKGVFDVQTLAETGGVTFDELKGGWYTASGERAIAKFYVDGSGNVGSITDIDTDYWHYIGDTGEPTLDIGSEVDAATYGKTRFRKTGKTVKIKGFIDLSGNGTVFTLPAGHRPLNYPILRSLDYDVFATSETWYWTINTDGTFVNTGGALDDVLIDVEFDVNE